MYNDIINNGIAIVTVPSSLQVDSRLSSNGEKSKSLTAPVN